MVESLNHMYYLKIPYNTTWGMHDANLFIYHIRTLTTRLIKFGRGIWMLESIKQYITLNTIYCHMGDPYMVVSGMDDPNVFIYTWEFLPYTAGGKSDH